MLLQHKFSSLLDRFLPPICGRVGQTRVSTDFPVLLPPSVHRQAVRARLSTFICRARGKGQTKTFKEIIEIEEREEEGGRDERKPEDLSTSIDGGNKEYEDQYNEECNEEFTSEGAFRGRGDEKDYDRDPEIAEILGSYFDDPEKGQSMLEERIKKKRNKILHAKTGSAIPMKVVFKRFDFSNSYIWFEFYNVPLPKDVTLICDTLRAWHITGRLGGCNSMNMQLSQSIMDSKRPRYDIIQGANVTPTTFYNIGDLEIQDNLARIWVDIGTSEPLLLDILVNALTSISSDYVGIKLVVFGGFEFENWKENLTSEDAGCSTFKI
ncbi:hypothetical protein HPP92_013011 [Vanilla planifolia]|uniref:Uncharacterized protein n=1 Tax=Vanilla planifolia TaxID=51239 RepID=A0A835UXK9_VANPL|nr:hypothetical protein HPP92_013011 [Vanilla planifolia]